MKLRASAQQTRFSWKNFLWILGVHLIAVVGCILFWSWQGFFVFVAMSYVAGMIGITFGFHRLLTHKGFKTPRFIENIAAFCGTLACQGGPISWVGQHRVHHAYSDQEEDPHNIKRGFWYSHILFLFERRQDLDSSEEVAHYCPDIAARPFLQFLEKNMIVIQFAVGIALFIMGGFFGNSQVVFDFYYATSWMVWGIFVRLVWGYHITWLVNSATHSWGSRPNETRDESRNNWWVGILAFGEGWHNNHHAQPRAARHGWKWWQLDQTWMFICALKYAGLIKDIKLAERSENEKGKKVISAGVMVGEPLPVKKTVVV
jgi:fatty-acid desaturase